MHACFESFIQPIDFVLHVVTAVIFPTPFPMMPLEKPPMKHYVLLHSILPCV